MHMTIAAMVDILLTILFQQRKGPDSQTPTTICLLQLLLKCT
jgi:hypothetical protein